MSAYDFDYFVIGAGSGGVRSARIAATHGAKVGIAEVSALGGTCVNLGCIPKKLLAYASDYTHHFHDAKGYGWGLNGKPVFDWPALIENKNHEIARLNVIYQTVLENSGAELIHGYARFKDEHTLMIDEREVSAEKILIAVGGKPRMPDFEGGHLMISSDEVFSWPTMPQHVVIQGGGYIAVEFAHIFRGLGAKVTLVYRGDMILRGFDDDIRQALTDEFGKQGIELRCGQDIVKVEKNAHDYCVTLDDGSVLTCDLPMTAIGRIPNVDGLNLSAAGVELKTNGQIMVDEHYATSRPHIFALGDVANNHNLTPVAIKEGHVLADRLFGGVKEDYVNYNNIATAVFSDPPISTVGLTEADAKKNNLQVDVYKTNFRALKHTLGGRDERTIMKLVVDAKTDKVLGVHMMGQDAPEIMQGFAVALNAGATKADFDRTMPMHPTSAEEFVTLRQKC